MIFALQVISAVLFGVATLGITAPVRDRLIAAGLLALTGSFLVSSYPG